MSAPTAVLASPITEVIASGRRAARDYQRMQRTWLDVPMPGADYAGEAEPCFVETCNQLKWAPWQGPRPETGHYPLVVLEPLPDDADAPPTLAIDMSALLVDPVQITATTATETRL